MIMTSEDFHFMSLASCPKNKSINIPREEKRRFCLLRFASRAALQPPCIERRLPIFRVWKLDFTG